MQQSLDGQWSWDSRHREEQYSRVLCHKVSPARPEVPQSSDDVLITSAGLPSSVITICQRSFPRGMLLLCPSPAKRNHQQQSLGTGLQSWRRPRQVHCLPQGSLQELPKRWKQQWGGGELRCKRSLCSSQRWLPAWMGSHLGVVRTGRLSKIVTLISFDC